MPSQTASHRDLIRMLAPLLCALLVTSPTPLQAQIPVYELLEDALPDIHDSSLDDWLDLVPGPSLTTADFSDWQTGAAMDRGDQVEVYLGWCGATARIYVGIARVDDVVDNPYVLSEQLGVTYLPPAREQIVDTQDGYDFSVDGDHSGGIFWSREPVPADATEDELAAWLEARRSVRNVHAQRYEATAVTGTGRHLQFNNIYYMDWATTPPYGDGGGSQWGTSPGASVCEFYVTAWDTLNYHGPEYSRASVLRAGAVIGLNVLIWDHDDLDGSAVSVYEPATQVHSGTPSMLWCDALLVGHPEAPHSTAVSSCSWGSIKRGAQQGQEVKPVR